MKRTMGKDMNVGKSSPLKITIFRGTRDHMMYVISVLIRHLYDIDSVGGS
jgi:hypothetical protein